MTDDFDPDTWAGNKRVALEQVSGPFCTMQFTVETNGRQGGDWGHGSRLKITLESIASVAMQARVDGQQGDSGFIDKLEILVGGDDELRVFSLALERLAHHLYNLTEVQEKQP